MELLLVPILSYATFVKYFRIGCCDNQDGINVHFCDKALRASLQGVRRKHTK